jgi:NADPH:quinone reductase-like Zn-dependent oxidoreductase
MKAMVVRRFGGPGVMHSEIIDRPSPRGGQVLIQVRAASVNPVDTKIRAGAFKAALPDLPATLGRDVSGIVAAAPRNSRFRVGEPVFGILGYNRGAYGEYAIANGTELARRPAKVPDAEASTLGVAALTAWQGLFDHGQLKKGERVLIHGGAGGVGHFAVQFAKLKGATVIVTASARDHAWLTRLGADQVIDYHDEKFEEVAGAVDLVFDLIAGETQERSWQTLIDRGGRLVSTLTVPSSAEARRHRAKAVRMMTRTDPKQLAEIAKLVARGKVKVHIGKKFPLAKAVDAHVLIENGHVRGKVVLTVASHPDRRQTADDYLIDGRLEPFMPPML